MTVQALYDQIAQQLSLNPRSGVDQVVIRVGGHSMGPTPVEQVCCAETGFDWDDGNFIITPLRTLIVTKDVV
jgi:hypothetical protein